MNLLIFSKVLNWTLNFFSGMTPFVVEFMLAEIIVLFYGKNFVFHIHSCRIIIIIIIVFE